MEKYTMFMDWKKQYSENEYTTQNNLQIQCNPYQATNDIFHRARTYNFTICAAKSLQLCPTLCNPIDGSPLGSSVPGILQARTLEWVAISFSTNLLKFAQIYVH